MIEGLVITISIGLFVAIVEYLYFLGVDSLVTRKLAHIGAGAIVALMPFFIDLSTALVIGLIFSVVLFISKNKRIIPSIFESEGSNMGTVLFTPGLMISAFIFWDINVQLFQLSVLVLIFADSIAGYVGEKYGKINYNITGKKTLEGSIVFFIITTLIFIIWSLLIEQPNIISNASFLTLIFASGVLAMIEGILGKGKDNLVIPIATGLILLLII